MRKAMVAAIAAAAVFAGCGGDDDETTTQGSQETQTQTQTATETQPTETSAAAPGEIPSYEEVAEIALENEGTKRSCGLKREDNDIGSYPSGETYKRLLCNGAQHMDYVVGKEAFGENFEAAREGRSPIWRYEDTAYATGPALDDEFAQKVKDACDCGEVVKGTRE